jgi:hypothetical protein
MFKYLATGNRIKRVVYAWKLVNLNIDISILDTLFLIYL